MYIKIIFAVFTSYILGSIPNGYLLCKIFKGIDIRNEGSKNIGATNVTRVVGKKFGIATLVLDVLKGLLAVTVIPFIFGISSDYAKMFCALGAVSGHNWTIFLGFKGGKGVATTAGTLIGLMPIIFLSVFLVWCAVFAVCRYVSVASITAAICLPIFLFLYGESLIFKILGFIVAMAGIVRHKENIKRLLKGEEKKLIFK